MPTDVSDFFDRLSVFSELDLELLGPLECYGLGGYVQQLVFVLVLPVALVLGILALAIPCAAASCQNRCCIC